MNTKYEKIFLLLTDFLSLLFAALLYLTLRAGTGVFNYIFVPDFYIPILILYIYWLLIFFFVGLYQSWFASSRFDEISSLFKATFIGIIILFVIIFIDDFTHNVSSTSRFLIFIYWGISFVFVSTGRLIFRGVQRNLLIKGIGRRNALMVGFNKDSNEVHKQINSHRALGLDVVGYLATNPENVGKSFLGIDVIGKAEEIEKYIGEKNIKEVIVAFDKHYDELLLSIINKCEDKNVAVKIVPDLFELLSGQARTNQLYGFPLVEVNPRLMPEWEKKAKRLFDILISFLILILTFPLLVIIGIAIKLDSEGPVFYKQERCGIGGKIFKIYKFRTMKKDAEKLSGPVWSQKNDPRITRVGKFLRKVRMDELPQMLNILKGEMSLVGPRPERPFFVEKFALEIPYYKRRLRVKPGVTGWAQVKHKYDENIEDVKTKLKFDLFYIENMSLRMDLKILIRTIFVVLFGKGHYD